MMLDYSDFIVTDVEFLAPALNMVEQIRPRDLFAAPTTEPTGQWSAWMKNASETISSGYAQAVAYCQRAFHKIAGISENHAVQIEVPWFNRFAFAVFVASMGFMWPHWKSAIRAIISSALITLRKTIESDLFPLVIGLIAPKNWVGSATQVTQWVFKGLWFIAQRHCVWNGFGTFESETPGYQAQFTLLVTIQGIISWTVLHLWNDHRYETTVPYTVIGCAILTAVLWRWIQCECIRAKVDSSFHTRSCCTERAWRLINKITPYRRPPNHEIKLD